MCEPTTIITMTALAASAMGAAGAVYQGDAVANGANHSAKVQEINARTQEAAAADAIRRGGDEERKHRQQLGQLKGRQRAAQAASGIDVTFGSALDLAEDTALMGELDALTIRSNAYNEAFDLKTGASNSRAAAAASRQQATSARTGSYISAGSTLLTGAANAYAYRGGSAGGAKTGKPAPKVRIIF